MTTTVRAPKTNDTGPSVELPSTPVLSVSRLSRWFLFMYVAMFTVRTTVDPDLFWHLRTGELIVNNGIPRSDVFSFTVPDNGWVTHEWLTQVLGWGAYSLGGFTAVSFLFAAVGAIAVAFTYHTLAGGPIQRVLLTAATMAVATISFGARPQLFTLAFAAGFVWLVEQVRSGRFPAAKLWWAVPTMVVWANLHSGFLLGVVILGTYAVGDTLTRRFFPTDNTVLPVEVAAKLMKIAGVAFVAAVLNPSGPKLWIYPFETLRSEEMRELIAEWHSPDFHISLLRPFLVLIVVAFAVLAASKLRPSITDILLVGGTMAAALMSLRHVALAAVVTMPVLARHLSSAVKDTRMGPWLAGDRDRGMSVGPVFAGVVALVLGVVVVASVGGKLATNQTTIESHYPAAAVDWLEEEGLVDQHGYNEYGWGGYLIWRGVEVFSDGRADVYGDDFLNVIRRLNDADREWEQLLNEYEVKWALVSPDKPLTAVLLADSDWRIAYEDEVAVVLTRND